MDKEDIIYASILAVVCVLGFMRSKQKFIESKRKIIGGLIGGVLGAVAPMIPAQLYVWGGGDPTAAGALFVISTITFPLGLIMGIEIGSQMEKHKPQGKQTKNEDEV